jgi:hypothetical protein
MFTAFTVIQSGGGSSVNSPSVSASSFTFPYQYGTPTVPSDVGAQGIQGPNVPYSKIGIQVPISNLGPQTHVGPVNETSPNPLNPWPDAPVSSVSIHVLNGTYGGSDINAVGVKVDIYNATTSNEISLITTKYGWANTTLSEGAWQITALSVNYNDNFNFSQFVHVTSTSYTKTVYLVPVSYDEITVSNGPAADDNETLVYSAYGGFGDPAGLFFYPVSVQLVNTSASPNTVISTGLLASANNSVVFLKVNSEYSYKFLQNSTDPFTGTSIGNVMMNAAQGIGVQNKAGTYKISAPSYTGLEFNSTSTGTISGSTPSFAGWSLLENTTVTGGTTYINTAIHAQQPYYHLTFINAVVIFNVSTYPTINAPSQSNDIIILKNSTFDSYGTMNSMLFSSYNSIIIGDWYKTGEHNNYLPVDVYSSSIYYMGSFYTVYSVGTAQNSTFDNISYSYGRLFNSGPTNSLYDDFYYSSFGVDNTSGVNVRYEYDIFNYNTSVFLSQGESYGTYYPDHPLFMEDMFGSNYTAIIQGSSKNLTVQYSNFTITFPTGINPLTSGNISGIQWSSDNFSFDYFSSIEIPSIGYGVTATHIYDDIFYTPIPSPVNDTKLVYWYSNYRYSHHLGLFGATSGVGGRYISYSVFIGATGSLNSNNSIFSHNLIKYDATPATATNTGPFYTGIAGNITFANNTWEMSYSNYSEENSTDWVNSFDNGGLTGEWSNYPYTYITVTHNSFYDFLVGGGLPQGFLGTAANVTYNVFYNNQSYGVSKYWSSPYGADTRLGAPPGYRLEYIGNYFLNLNSATWPIFDDENNLPVILQNNHFYYSPEPIAKYVWGNTQYSTIQAGSPAYSLTFNKGIAITSQSQEYVYNASIAWNYDGAPMQQWAVVPDVNIISGSPTISYSNGLVGGPQPNFEWKGYNYSESVEPTYIQVGVNSSKAPSIGLQFQGIANALYDVEMLNNGTVVSTFTEHANATGILNATYNPATMPLDPVFTVAYVGSALPPPIIPPTVPVIPRAFFGIPYLNVAVLLGGIVLTVEEFMRTHARNTRGKSGRESSIMATRKYAYTGMFIGILITGIGIMSVI